MKEEQQWGSQALLFFREGQLEKGGREGDGRNSEKVWMMCFQKRLLYFYLIHLTALCEVNFAMNKDNVLDLTRRILYVPRAEEDRKSENNEIDEGGKNRKSSAATKRPQVRIQNGRSGI